MSTLFIIKQQQEQQQALGSIKRHCNIVCALQYKFVPSRRMSYTLTYVRVALASSDIQSILDVAATAYGGSKPCSCLNQAELNSDIFNTQQSQQTCALRV